MLFLLQAEAAASAIVPALAVQCDLREETSGKQAVLRGGCGETPVVLGIAEKREIAKNVKTGSTAVVQQSDGLTTIYVIRPSVDGRPIIEDLTAELEAKAGGTGRGGLRGFTVDLSRYADDGLVIVTPEGAAAGKKSAQASVLAMVEAEAARLARPALMPKVIAVVPEGKSPDAAPGAARQTFLRPRSIVDPTSPLKTQADALKQGGAAK